MIQEKEPFNEAGDSQNVLEFVRVAHEYCIFTEKASEKNSSEILDFMLKIGALLYLKGKLLPVITPEYPENSERYVTEEEWQEVFNTFRNLFGTEDEYYLVSYEEFNEYEAVKASLSENLADIYQDLKDFLLLFGKNSESARQNAIYECKALFESRWGPRILSCMRYFHFLCNRNSLIEQGNDYDL